MNFAEHIAIAKEAREAGKEMRKPLERKGPLIGPNSLQLQPSLAQRALMGRRA